MPPNTHNHSPICRRRRQLGQETPDRTTTRGRPFSHPHKKNDVAERSGAFRHVGLLTNAPSGSRRLALYLVVRGFRENFQFRTSLDPMILPLAAANTSTVWSITANRHLFNASCPARGTKTLDWHKERHLTVAPETDFAVLRDTLPKSRSLCCSRLSARNPAHRCYWRRFRASGSARSWRRSPAQRSASQAQRKYCCQMTGDPSARTTRQEYF